MSVKEFFGLDKRKLVLFIFFSIVVYFGMVQTWAFCKECSPKPLLYDAIAGFPFWGLWIYLSLPIQIMSAFLLQSAVSFLINLLYFFVVSCFMVYFFERFRKEFSKKVIAFWAVIFIALNLYNIVVLPLIASTLGEQIVVSATQPTILETLGFFFAELIAFAFYAFLISSIFFIIKDKLNFGKRNNFLFPKPSS